MTATAPSNRKIIAEIIDFVETQVKTWYGDDAVLDTRNVALRLYPYSFFLHIPLSTHAKSVTLLAKIKRQPKIESIADALAIERLKKPAQDEYEMTKKIYATFEQQNCAACTAVKPLAYLPQWNALVMEAVEGEALKAYLLSARVFFRLPSAKRKLSDLLAASARWLRVFHRDVSQMQLRPFPTEKAWHDVEESLKSLETHSRGRANIAVYRRAFQNALSALADSSVPFGVVHDDFHYSNILVDKQGRVCTIDNAGDYRHCAYVDLATLITDPQTRTWQIVSKGFFISPDFIRTWRKIILENYFERTAYNTNAVTFFSALAVLNKWSEGLGRLSLKYQGKIPVFILRRIDTYFSALLSAYLSELTPVSSI